MPGQGRPDRPVLVTTKNQGVYFGYVVDDSDLPNSVTLREGRVCLDWDTGQRGFLGLAKVGPNAECRVSRPVDVLTVFEITSISDCSTTSRDEWEKGPWRPD